MGQNQSRVLSFIPLIHDLLKKCRINVTRQQMQSCLKVVCKYNPWLPAEGTPESQVWDRAWKQVEEVRMTEDIPADVWGTWSLINSVITITEGQDRAKILQQTVMGSLDDYGLHG